MTKYILNSGTSPSKPEKTNKFNREIVKGLGKTPNILFCYFATPRENWEEKFFNHTKLFTDSMKDDVKPRFELAFPDKFNDQIKNNDVIMINGGDDNLLLSYLKQYNLPDIWEGKTVVGSSAGSNSLAVQFWTCDWRMVKNGLGILPIKFIPHFKSLYGQNDPRGPIDWEDAYKKLKESGDRSLPIHALEEGNFIIIEQ